MDAFYGRKVRLQALEAMSHLHIALFFLIFSLLYPSPLILGPSVESDRGRGGWAFGEEGETIPEMSCYYRRGGCMVWFKR